MILITSGGKINPKRIWPGRLADLRIWFRALSDDEVGMLGCNLKDGLAPDMTLRDFRIVGPGIQQRVLGANEFQCWVGEPTIGGGGGMPEEPEIFGHGYA